MMNNVSKIELAIIEKAEKELSVEIQRHIRCLQVLIGTDGAMQWTMNPATVNECLKDVGELAFKNARRERIDSAISEFISKNV